MLHANFKADKRVENLHGPELKNYFFFGLTKSGFKLLLVNVDIMGRIAHPYHLPCLLTN